MTGRTEPPDLKRHLAQLERRVEQIERASRIRRTAQRPRTPAPHPSVTVRRTSAQGIPHATDTILTWHEVVGSDPLGMWNGSDGMVCRVDGVYAAWYTLKWFSDETGQRSVHLALTRASGGGAVSVIDDHQGASTGAGIVGQSSSRPIRMAVGDVMRVTVLQQTGAPFGPQTLDVLAGAEFSPYAGLQWLSS